MATDELKPLDSGSIECRGFPMHWEKYGTGPTVVLLLPGAMGTAKSDWKKQLSGPLAFDMNRYTFIHVDLPGWGQSRPPKRPYGMNLYENDVLCVLEVMEKLNYSSFSVLGWSDGAKISLLCAIKQPSRVQAVAACGIFIYGTKNNLLPTLKTQRIETWNKEMVDHYTTVYDRETLQKLWDDHINWCKELYSPMVAAHAARPELKEIRFGVHEDLMTSLGTIRCPVMLIHGEKDPLCPVDQAVYCTEKIANCQLRRFPDASHNVHQTHTEEFKKIIDQFFEDSFDFY